MSHIAAQALTKETLLTEYYTNKINKREIARKYDVTLVTVMRRMKKFGIQRQPGWVFRGQDLSGKHFGRLTVIERAPLDRHHKSRWRCRCKCGKTITINASSLIRQLSSSCGCLQSELNRTGYKDISGSWWRRLKQSAEHRGRECTITPQYIWGIYEKQGRVCALSGLPIKFCADSNKPQNMSASLDRIDNTKGYIRGNVQLVHKLVNLSRSWLSVREYVAICNLVADKEKMTHEDSINSITRRVASKVGY